MHQGNGLMDFMEFVKLMTTRNQFLMDDDDLKEAFRIFDKDNRGYIMSSELRYLDHKVYANIVNKW